MSRPSNAASSLQFVTRFDPIRVGTMEQDLNKHLNELLRSLLWSGIVLTVSAMAGLVWICV